MGHIFISYSRKDQNYANDLAESLRKQGFDVWIDDRIDYGERWWQTIVSAIRDCDVFIIIMTPDSEDSKWVEREILVADREKKPIFPILLKGREFSLLVTEQFVDVRNGKLPPEDFYKSIGEVLTPKNKTGQFITPASDNVTVPPLARRKISKRNVVIGSMMILVLALISGLVFEILSRDNNREANNETRTNTPPAIAQNIPTPTSTPSSTATAEPLTNTPTSTNTTSALPTNTSTSTREVSLTPTASDSPTATHTQTSTGTPTLTASATATNTYIPTSTDSPTPTATSTNTSTWTYTPSPTRTKTPTPTKTRTPTRTPTRRASSTPRPPETTVTVTSDSANLRSGPGTNYSIVGSASNGDTFDVVAKSDDWYLIERDSGSKAWIWADLVELNPSNAIVQVAATIPAAPTSSSGESSSGSTSSGSQLPVTFTGSLDPSDGYDSNRSHTRFGCIMEG